MASGTVYGSVTYKTDVYTYYFTWSSTKNPSKNTSTVTVNTYWGRKSSWTFDTVGTRNWSITIAGKTFSGSKRFDYSPWVTTAATTATHEVAHNADGTCSITISTRTNGHANVYGPSASTASGDDCTASKTVTLDTIGHYTISYNANGGTGAPSAQTKIESVNLTLSSTKPTRSGYTFKGWSTSSTATSATYQPSSTFTANGNYTLYAVWKANTIKISLDPNGGSGGTSAFYYKYGISKFYSDSACTKQITSISIPTRTGHTFANYLGSGRHGSQDGYGYIRENGTYFSSILATDIYENCTLYGAWTVNSYTLSINPNGGSYNGSTSTKEITQNYGTTYTISNPTRKGYAFGGWIKSLYGSITNAASQNSYFSGGNGSVGVYNNAGDGSVTITREAVSTPWGDYHLKINSTAGSHTPGLGGFVQRAYSAANQTFIHTFMAKIPVGYSVYHANNAVGTGSYFTWLTPRDGTGDWATYSYKLTCGSSGTFNDFGYVYIQDNGQNTVTWYLASSQVTNITSGNCVFTFGESTTWLRAHWVKNKYTISYNANGGSGSMSSHDVYFGDSVKIKDNTFTRSGYKFIGWTTKSDGTNDGYGWSYASGSGWSGTWSYVDGEYGISGGQLVLYARWELDICYITYNGNGNIVSNVPSQQSATIGTTVQLSSNSPTRTRYKFLGWSTNSSATSASYQPGANYNATGNITLYAVWQLLDKDIYLYKTGEIDAVDFIIVSSVSELFDSNGKIYGTEFITHAESNIYIENNGKIYAKNFIKY